MLFHLLTPMADQFPVLNVFRYLTFRTGGAIITALVVGFLFGPVLINMLKDRQSAGQPIRSDGPEGHLLTKQGTPTMGGFLILLALTVATLLWADLTNPYIWVALSVTIAYGVIGFFDDYLKITRKDSKGLSGKLKLMLQTAIALVGDGNGSSGRYRHRQGVRRLQHRAHRRGLAGIGRFLRLRSGQP